MSGIPGQPVNNPEPAQTEQPAGEDAGVMQEQQPEQKQLDQELKEEGEIDMEEQHSQHLPVDYEEVLNSFQRRVEKLSQTNSQLKASLEIKQGQIQQLLIDLQKWQQACAHKSYQIVTVRAQNEASSRSKEQYKHLYEISRVKLKEFESMESAADLEAKLKQSTLKIQGLEMELQNSYSRCVALEATQGNFDQLQSLQTIQKLKENISAKDIERAILVKQIAQFHKHIQIINQQLSEQLIKSNSLEMHIKDISDRLKVEGARNIQLISELKECKDLITKKDGELVHLCEKLESEIKRKREQESSNHLVEKEALLKDYLYLEKQHAILQERFRSQLAKNEKTQHLLTEAKHQNVSKSQYDLLAKRYVQAKKCLESAMKRLADTGANTSQIASVSEQKEFESKNLLLQSQLQQLQQYKKLNQITRNPPISAEEIIELASLRQKVARQDKLLAEAEHSVEVMQGQMTSRESFLQQFKDKCFEYTAQLDKMQKEHARAVKQTRQLQADQEITRIKMKGLQARQMQLLAYQGQLQKEASNWRNAYEALKQKDKIREQSLLNSKNIIQEHHPLQTQIQLKVVEAERCVITASHETQTQSVEFHLNQLRAMTASGKEYLHKLSQVAQPLELFKKELQAEKNKYVGLMTTYNQKYKALKAEKQELDQWKSKTREELDKQIREDFQEIRELVENDRLLTALKKAKHLIEEYDKEYDEGQGDKEQEDKEHPEKEEGGKTPAPDKDQDNNDDADEEMRPDDPLAL